MKGIGFLSLAALAVGALAACGGGGGSSPTPLPIPSATFAPHGSLQASYRLGAIKLTAGFVRAPLGHRVTDDATPTPGVLAPDITFSLPDQYVTSPPVSNENAVAFATVTNEAVPSPAPIAAWTQSGSSVTSTPATTADNLPTTALPGVVQVVPAAVGASTLVVSAVLPPSASATEMARTYNALALGCAPGGYQPGLTFSFGKAVPATSLATADLYVTGPSCSGEYADVTTTVHFPGGGVFVPDFVVNTGVQSLIDGVNGAPFSQLSIANFRNVYTSLSASTITSDVSPPGGVAADSDLVFKTRGGILVKWQPSAYTPSLSQVYGIYRTSIDGASFDF